MFSELNMLIRPQERTQNREPQRPSTNAEIFCAWCAFLWPSSSLQIKAHPAVFLMSSCVSGIVPNRAEKIKRQKSRVVSQFSSVEPAARGIGAQRRLYSKLGHCQK